MFTPNQKDIDDLFEICSEISENHDHQTANKYPQDTVCNYCATVYQKYPFRELHSHDCIVDKAEKILKQIQDSL